MSDDMELKVGEEGQNGSAPEPETETPAAEQGEVVKADEPTVEEESGEKEKEEGKDKGDFVVRARGLPWSATEADLAKFFGDAGSEIGEVAFGHNREGRPSGEAYIMFKTKAAFETALTKDHCNMGHRYIEVFASEKSEMDDVARNKESGSFKDDTDPVVRLRGLPYGCTKEEICNFFTGLEITPNGIVMPCDQSGRPSGEAFVQFIDKSTAEDAIKRHMRSIGTRYIEVFRSSRDELGSVMRRLGTLPAGSGMGGGGPIGGGFRGYGGSGRAGPYDRADEGGRFSGGGGGGGRWGGGGGRFGYEERDAWGGGGSGMAGYARGGGGYGAGAFGASGAGFGAGYGASWDRPSGGGPMRTGGGGRYSGGGGSSGGGPWLGGVGGRGNGTVIRMRGIPFSASEREIKEFFSPIRLANVEVQTEARSGRPSGEALVEFFTQSDASRAMERDRQHMGSRYVELFIQ